MMKSKLAVNIGLTAFGMMLSPVYADVRPTDDKADEYQEDATSTQASSSDEPRLGEVVVTAQKRSERLQETPVAVSAFSVDDITQESIATFRDISGKVPGLVVPKRSTSYTTQQYSMRGVGEIDTFPEPTVAVYVDDVYLARTVGSIYDTPDLERVEVLRGPQGTLYGRNSSAGAIKFITKDATSDPGGEVSASYGNYNHLNLKARINGAILDDERLNGSLSVVRRTRDGWTRSVPLGKDVNDLDLTVLRTKLNSVLSDKLSTSFSADGMWDRSSQTYYTPYNQPNGLPGGGSPDPDKTWSNTKPLNKTEVYGGSLTFYYDFSPEITLKSVSAWRGMQGPIYYDNDGVTWIKGDSYAGFNQHYWTQEFNLNGSYERLDYVLGLYYFDEFFNNNRLGQAASSNLNNVGVRTWTDSDSYTKSWAVFGQLDYDLTESFSTTLGARYTVERKKFDNVGATQAGTSLIYPLPGGGDPDLFPTLFSNAATRYDVEGDWETYTSLTPKLGFQYKFSPDLMVYVSYSQGFKSGGFDLRATSLESSITPYDPQTTTAYEAGIKAAWFNNRLITNLAVYRNNIDEFQVRAQTTGALGNTGSFLINAGEAHSQGVELEITALPTENLKLGFNLAYLETEYDKFTATLPNNEKGLTTLEGLDFPYAPAWQASATLNYRIPLSIPGALRLGLDANFESKRYSDLLNTEQTSVASQTFINGTINWTSPDGSLTSGLEGKNLTDLRRPQSGGYRAAFSGTETTYYHAYSEPRFFNVFVTQNF
jgi:iron complex outermembrane receptor protein